MDPLRNGFGTTLKAGLYGLGRFGYAVREVGLRWAGVPNVRAASTSQQQASNVFLWQAHTACRIHRASGRQRRLNARRGARAGHPGSGGRRRPGQDPGASFIGKGAPSGRASSSTSSVR